MTTLKRSRVKETQFKCHWCGELRPREGRSFIDNHSWRICGPYCRERHDQPAFERKPNGWTVQPV